MSATKQDSGGIFYGWIVVAIAFVTMAVAINARTGYSLLFPAISAEYGWSSATIVGAFSIGFVGSSAFIPIIGIVMDRYGPKAAIPMGAILVAAGYFGAIWIASPLGLYVALGLMAVLGSMAMGYIGHSMFLPNWFVRNRGLAVGIAFSGVGFGAIVLLPALQWAIDSFGWRTACAGIAAMIVIVVIPLNVLFQRRRPEDMDLLPDGDADPVKSGGPKPPDPIVDPDWAGTDWTLNNAMRTTRFWWIAVAYFCSLFVWYGIQIHQTNFLLDIGIKPTEAAAALGLVALFGIAGQIALGSLSDRLGREVAWSIAAAGFGICAVLLFVLEGFPNRILLYCMVVVQGLLGYGLASLYGAIPAEIFSGQQFARIFAALSLIGNVGAGVGVLVLGVIDDRFGGYQPGWIICVIASIVSIGCIWMAAPRKVRLVAGRAKARAANI